MSGRDRWLDALEQRLARLAVPTSAERPYGELRILVRPPASGTLAQVDGYRQLAAATRRRFREAPDDSGLVTRVWVMRWRHPVIVADEPLRAPAPTGRAALTLIKPDPDPTYCGTCGYEWLTLPRPVHDPCPKCATRAHWGRIRPPSRSPGGFAFVL